MSRINRIPDVRYPKKVERRKRDYLRVHGVRTPPPDDTERASLSGATPFGFPKMTRGALPYLDSFKEKHTALTIITPRTIAYPIRICCPDEKKRKEPTFRRSPMVCPDTLSGHLLSWISKNSPQSWIALVIKLLTKNTKTYTI